MGRKKKKKKRSFYKKNIRLSHKAWVELRNLKLEYNVKTYIDVFNKIIEENFNSRGDWIKLKLEVMEKMDEQDKIGFTGEILKSEKTIVVSREIHQQIAQVKVDAMYESERTSRGPGSISISDVVEVILAKYVKK